MPVRHPADRRCRHSAGGAVAGSDRRLSASAATGVMMALGAGAILLVPRTLLAAPSEEEFPDIAAQPTSP
jgi:hypothetical protein